MLSRRKLIVAGSVLGAVVLVAGGVWGGYSAAVASTEADLAAANASIQKVSSADAAVAKKLTGDQATAKSVSGSGRPLVASLGGFAAADSLTSLAAQLDALDKISAGAGAAHLATSPVKSRDTSLGALQEAVKAARASAARDKNLAAENVAAKARLEKRLAGVNTSLTAVAKTVPAASASVLSANPKADATVRAAFQSQAGTVGVATGQATIAALAAYAAKAKAVLDSQATVIAQEQAAAARGTSGGATSSDSSSPGTSTSGPGASSSGGAPSRSNPVPTIPQRGLIFTFNSACEPGNSSEKWENNLGVPATAINVRVTFEHPGVDWGISWQCDTGQ